MPEPDSSPAVERCRELSAALVGMIQITVDATEIARECLAPNVNSNRQVQLMLLVSRNEGISPAVLAERMQTSRSLVSQVLRGLIRAGFVRREPDPRDRRSFRILLTVRGQAAISRAEAELAAYFLAEQGLVERIAELLDGGSDGEAGPEPTMLGAVGSIAAAAAGYVTEAVRIVAPWGFGDNERFVLTLVCSPGSHRPNELGAMLGISSAAVSLLLDRMEAVGAVVRHPNPDLPDGRAVLIEPTADGRRVADELATALAPHAAALGTALRSALASGPRTGAA